MSIKIKSECLKKWCQKDISSTLPSDWSIVTLSLSAPSFMALRRFSLVEEFETGKGDIPALSALLRQALEF